MKIPGLRHSAEQVGGIVFFGRMLDKIRLHAQGKLPADYNRGVGFDGRVCRFLHVEYPAMVERVLAGGSDEEILAWCSAQGRQPNEEEILIFNAFMTKRGWHDDSSEDLEEMKYKRGIAGRHCLESMHQPRSCPYSAAWPAPARELLPNHMPESPCTPHDRWHERLRGSHLHPRPSAKFQPFYRFLMACLAFGQ